MARIDLYLSDEEKEYVKQFGPGFVRDLIKNAMQEDEQPAVPTKKTVRGVPIPTGGEPPSPRRVQNACRFCGGVTMAGKCMACKAVQ